MIPIRWTAAVLAPVGLAVTAALAHEGHVKVAASGERSPQIERWELMDEIGKNMKTMGDMVRGNTAYDAAEVTAALDVLVENGEAFPALFPPGTETGHDTRALPAIWENKADFEAQTRDMVEAARAAKGPAQDGLDAFRPAFQRIGATCRDCHTDYRAEEN